MRQNGSENLYDLITSRFVTQNNHSDPRFLDTFDGSTEKFMENANLFPDKFSDLEGRVVRLALFNYKPYTIWEQTVK